MLTARRRGGGTSPTEGDAAANAKPDKPEPTAQRRSRTLPTQGGSRVRTSTVPHHHPPPRRGRRTATGPAWNPRTAATTDVHTYEAGGAKDLRGLRNQAPCAGVCPDEWLENLGKDLCAGLGLYHPPQRDPTPRPPGKHMVPCEWAIFTRARQSSTLKHGASQNRPRDATQHLRFKGPKWLVLSVVDLIARYRIATYAQTRTEAAAATSTGSRQQAALVKDEAPPVTQGPRQARSQSPPPGSPRTPPPAYTPAAEIYAITEVFTSTCHETANRATMGEGQQVALSYDISTTLSLAPSLLCRNNSGEAREREAKGEEAETKGPARAGEDEQGATPPQQGRHMDNGEPALAPAHGAVAAAAAPVHRQQETIKNHEPALAPVRERAAGSVEPPTRGCVSCCRWPPCSSRQRPPITRRHARWLQPPPQASWRRPPRHVRTCAQTPFTIHMLGMPRGLSYGNLREVSRITYTCRPVLLVAKSGRGTGRH